MTDDRSAMILPVVDAAIASTANTGFLRSASALNEAKRALMLQPPNVTGVVTDAIGALEGVLKQVGTGGSTIEHALRDNDWPTNFKRMVRASWVFANERARHITEYKPEPSYDGALFVLHIACAIIMRLLGSMHCYCCGVSSLKAEMSRSDACIKCGGPKHGCDYCKGCVDYEFKDEWEEESGAVWSLRQCSECVEREAMRSYRNDPFNHPAGCSCWDCEELRSMSQERDESFPGWT